MSREPWCKSPVGHPIFPGIYRLCDGTPVQVVQAASGRFYARVQEAGRWMYRPGVIYRLAAENAAGSSQKAC